jgi:hypothetical protein
MGESEREAARGLLDPIRRFGPLNQSWFDDSVDHGLYSPIDQM